MNSSFEAMPMERKQTNFQYSRLYKIITYYSFQVDPPKEHVEEVVVKEEVLVDDSYKCQFCDDYSVQSYVKLRTHMKSHANQKVA